MRIRYGASAVPLTFPTSSSHLPTILVCREIAIDLVQYVKYSHSALLYYYCLIELVNSHGKQLREERGTGG